MTGAYNKIKMCHQKNYWKGGYTETSYICCFICDLLQIFSFFPLSLSFSSSFFLIRIKKIRFLTIPDSINSTELYSLLHYFWSALHTSMNLWYFLPSKDMTRKKTRSGRKHWIHFMQADKKQLEQVFWEGGRCPIPGNIQGPFGLASEQLTLFEDVPPHTARGLDGRDFKGLFHTKPFSDSMTSRNV